MKNYYEILEVNRKASKEVIEKAYKVLVKKYHPDLQKNGRREIYETKIKDINEAYDVLSNDFLKEQYDKELDKQIAENYRKIYGQENSEKKQTNQNVNKYNKSKKTNSNNQKRQEEVDFRSFSGIIRFVKNSFKNRPKRRKLSEMTSKDLLAVFLTIIVVLLIGVVLWFIPFTNPWMRELLFENPVINAIGRLFTR